jgi:EAL domain-containing protein (putative c-di-GMP-specific phosphodiesterase class I)
MIQSLLPAVEEWEPASTSTRSDWHLEGCLTPRAELTRTRIVRVPFKIGRGPDADFRIPSPNVSKMHAELIIGGDNVFVRDLNSSNGTYVNGRRIDEPTPVGEGDLLQFADMEFRLKRDGNDAAGHTAMFDQPQSGWLFSQMHQVVAQRRFSMHFQPIVDSRTLKSVAVEALVRCSLTGLESPLQLFRSAAQLGLEQRVSQLCREEAVLAIAAHPGRETLFVNTHPNEHLGSDLIGQLRNLRELAGSRRIVLEIHESAIPEIDAMRSFRSALKDLGIGIAYDDFGAGQSRLLELAKAPPDYLKFDRSLLKGISEACVSQRAIVQTLVEIALDDGIQPVAEGLDDADTVEICREMGFTLLQGFYFARPMPAESLINFA